MNNKRNIRVEDEIAAREEGHILPQKLLNEIFPLLKEYFIGSFKLEDGAISMKFLNGESFKLTIGQVV